MFRKPLSHPRTLPIVRIAALLVVVLTLTAAPAFADRNGAISSYETRETAMVDDGWQSCGGQNVGWYVMGVIKNTPIEKSIDLDTNYEYAFVGGGDGRATSIEITLNDNNNTFIAREGSSSEPRLEVVIRSRGSYRLRIEMKSGNGLAWIYLGAFRRERSNDTTDPVDPITPHPTPATAIPIKPTPTPRTDADGRPMPVTGEPEGDYMLLEAGAKSSTSTDTLASIVVNQTATMQFNPRGAAHDASTLQPVVEFWFGRVGMALVDYEDSWGLAAVTSAGYEDLRLPAGARVLREQWNTLTLKRDDEHIEVYINDVCFAHVTVRDRVAAFSVRVVAYSVWLRSTGNAASTVEPTLLDAPIGQTTTSDVLGTLKPRTKFEHSFRPEQRYSGFTINAIEFLVGDRALSLVDRGSNNWKVQILDANGRRDTTWPAGLSITMNEWHTLSIERTAHDELIFRINDIQVVSLSVRRDDNADVRIRTRSYKASIIAAS